MAFDQLKPAVTDNYLSEFTQGIRANALALAMMLDSEHSTFTGDVPDYTKRYNRSSGVLEESVDSTWTQVPLMVSGVAAYQTGSFETLTLVYSSVANGNASTVIRSGGSTTFGATDVGYLELATAHQTGEIGTGVTGRPAPIYVRQYTYGFGTVTKQMTLLDEAGDTRLPGNLLPVATNSMALGTTGKRWNAAWINTVNGRATGNVQQGGGTGQTTDPVMVGSDGAGGLKATVGSLDLGNFLFEGSSGTLQELTVYAEGERSLNVNYTNSTSRAIWVWATAGADYASVGAGYADMQGRVDLGEGDFLVSDFSGEVSAAIPSVSFTVSFLVPIGAIYTVSTSSNLSFTQWVELRDAAIAPPPPPPPPPENFLEDTFTGTGDLSTHTPETGTWVALSGYSLTNLLLTGSGYVTCDLGGASQVEMVSPPTVSDFTMQAVCKFAPEADFTDDLHQAFFRMTAFDDRSWESGFHVGVQNHGSTMTSFLSADSQVTGDFVYDDSAYAGAYDTDITLKMVVSNSLRTVDFYINGALEKTHTLSNSCGTIVSIGFSINVSGANALISASSIEAWED